MFVVYRVRLQMVGATVEARERSAELQGCGLNPLSQLCARPQSGAAERGIFTSDARRNAVKLKDGNAASVPRAVYAVRRVRYKLSNYRSVRLKDKT